MHTSSSTCLFSPSYAIILLCHRIHLCVVNFGIVSTSHIAVSNRYHHKFLSFRDRDSVLNRERGFDIDTVLRRRFPNRYIWYRVDSIQFSIPNRELVSGCVGSAGPWPDVKRCPKPSHWTKNVFSSRRGTLTTVPCGV